MQVIAQQRKESHNNAITARRKASVGDILIAPFLKRDKNTKGTTCVFMVVDKTLGKDKRG